MPDTHALLGGSNAHRFLVCTPSARLEAQFPDEETEYAKEGTLAHAVCEAKLRFLKGDIEKIDVELTQVPDDMWEYTEQYADFVEEEWNAAKVNTPDAALFIEQKLDFSEYVPEGFGTADAVIISDDVLEVIDFKYGRGVAVSAVDNPQLKLYALGAYLAFSPIYNCTEVKATIFQPRLNSVTSDSYTVDELLEWGETYVKPRAKMAYDGAGDYVIGPHCQFCKAGSVCRARAEEAFSVIDQQHELPPVLSDEEITSILGKLDETSAWISALWTYVQNKAISEGKVWPGYKLVEARTNRKIEDQITAVALLNNAGYTTEEVTNTKLKGITELERLLGKKKFADILGGYVIKPKGVPVLVPNSDKRPAVNPVELAFKED